MKQVLVFGAVLVLLAGLGVLSKHLLWPERLDTKIAQSIDVDLSLKGVELSQGRQGKKLWNLKAQSANYAETSDELTLVVPHLVYWGENNTLPIEVAAPSGQVWQKADRARMWDGVNATRGEYKLFSADLMYSGKDRQLIMTGDVRLVGKTMQALSDTLIYFLDSGNFTAKGNVAVTMN